MELIVQTNETTVKKGTKLLSRNERMEWDEQDLYALDSIRDRGLLDENHILKQDIDISHFKKADRDIGCIHIMANSGEIDSKWMYPVLKDKIHPTDEVCVLALSFFDDTNNIEDWNKQFKKGVGIWYRANTDVFFRYGIKESQIHWVNYFTDSREEILKKIQNSNILMIPGGAPDLFMKRIKALKLKKVLKQYRGLMIGYSAGAMVQLDRYHITPDRDYPDFSYQSGFGSLSGFDIEVHYHASNHQKEYIQKVIDEKKLDVYAIYEDGALWIENNQIHMFGKVDLYEKE